MRILWSSNAPWVASGYGVQSRYLLPRLAALPEIGGAQNVAILAWFGMQGGVMEWGPFRVYPGGADSYGNDVIGAHCRDFGAERVITLIDVWVLEQTAKAVAPARWSPWFPIDSDPVPAKVLAQLEGADPPIVYSRWAQEMIQALGVASVYVPHGIEPSIFKFEPDAGLRAQWREALVGPGCTHLTVMNCANKGYPDRKFIQGQLRAWAAFAAGVPGARLYLHTAVSTDYSGIDVAALVTELGIADRVRYPDWYAYWLGMPAEFLACVYNAGDVFLGASMAEGFGIPIVEAQACGLPVIVTDFSSMPELVRWGKAVPAKDRIWTQLNSWQAWPDVAEITETLRLLYLMQQSTGGEWDPALRSQLSAEIHAEFGWDVVVEEYWAPLVGEWARAS